MYCIYYIWTSFKALKKLEVDELYVCSSFENIFIPLTSDLQNQKGFILSPCNICVKFDQNILHSLLSIIFTRLSLYLPITTLTLDRL